MTQEVREPTVLFVTVGFGDSQKLEETLYAPIAVSIRSGNWERIVLLPSCDTAAHAREIEKRHRDRDIHVRRLPPAAETEADQCYDYFERVISEFGRNHPPEDMCVDITRGTKVMSAALLLAAVRHRIPHVRYIEGHRQPENPAGIVPGSERVRDTAMRSVIKHRTLDDALSLFRHGSFAGTALLLSQLRWDEGAQNVATLATFCASWDQLDYRAADELTFAPESPLPWADWMPDAKVRGWVHELASPMPEEGSEDYARRMAARLRRLSADLLANGERRLRQHQYEDALLRAYRTLEMVGQARLFAHGLDSKALPSDHEGVRELSEELKKTRSAPLTENKDGTRAAGREHVARLLKRLGDPLAVNLMHMADRGPMKAKSRNNSILIHGFEAATVGRAEDLSQLYEELKNLVGEDGRAAGLVDTSPARFLNDILDSA